MVSGITKMHLCAQLAHEANRLYCRSIGDDSQKIWGEAEIWQQESVLKGIKGALMGNTPEQSHESWLEEKRRTGWKYGPVKDPEKKEHPCFRPYGELPEEQRRKDQLYLNVVRAMAHALELDSIIN